MLELLKLIKEEQDKIALSSMTNPGFDIGSQCLRAGQWQGLQTATNLIQQILLDQDKD